MNRRTTIPTHGNDFGCLALVAYLPEPLSQFLQHLGKDLPREHPSDPHVTILPPRPLRAPVDQASQYAFSVLDHFSSFEVELAGVRCFPNTNMLYLDMVDGDTRLHSLHSALNTDHLAAAEKFQYRPHVTLGGPIAVDAVQDVTERVEEALEAATVDMRFLVSEIVALWQSAHECGGDWQRLWTRPLGTAPQIFAARARVTNQRY